MSNNEYTSIYYIYNIYKKECTYVFIIFYTDIKKNYVGSDIKFLRILIQWITVFININRKKNVHAYK